MKQVFIFIFAFVASPCLVAQTFLVPYRVGDKFGLSDEKGILLVPPTYDNIQYVSGNYFQYANLRNPTDTSNVTKRATVERYTYGLFYKNTLLIKDEPHPHFLIVKPFIIASQNPYRPEQCTLYNLRGEKIIAEPIKALYFNDKRDVGQLGGLSNKFILISLITQTDKRANRVMSIAVFDTEKQQISSYLLEKVTNYKVNKDQYYRTTVWCNYTDAEGKHEKYIVFRNNAFMLINANELLPSEQEGELKTLTDEPRVVEERNVSLSDSRMDNVEAPPAPKPLTPKQQAEARAEAEQYAYYQITPDSLFYVLSNTRTHVNVPKNVTLIYRFKQAKAHRGAIIYKKGNRFGLVQKGVLGENKYDSLVYFRENYIVYQKINKRWTCGLMDKSEKMMIPTVYDSIQGELKLLKFAENKGSEQQSQDFVVKEKSNFRTEAMPNPYTQNGANNLIVFKNGKMGMVSDNNDIVIPIQYDWIIENGFNFQVPQMSGYILLKNSGLYGLTHLSYNTTTKKYERVNTVEPVFKDIPACYRMNFYQQKGLVLYELYGEQFQSLGYARAEGFLYFKE